jgi:hypothetical protein
MMDEDTAKAMQQSIIERQQRIHANKSQLQFGKSAMRGLFERQELKKLIQHAFVHSCSRPIRTLHESFGRRVCVCVRQAFARDYRLKSS